MNIKFTSPFSFTDICEFDSDGDFILLRKNLWFRDDMRSRKNKTIFEIAFHLDHEKYNSVIFIVKEDKVKVILHCDHGTHTHGTVTIENPEFLWWWQPIEEKI